MNKERKEVVQGGKREPGMGWASFDFSVIIYHHLARANWAGCVRLKMAKRSGKPQTDIMQFKIGRLLKMLYFAFFAAELNCSMLSLSDLII